MSPTQTKAKPKVAESPAEMPLPFAALRTLAFEEGTLAEFGEAKTALAAYLAAQSEGSLDHPELRMLAWPGIHSLGEVGDARTAVRKMLATTEGDE